MRIEQRLARLDNVIGSHDYVPSIEEPSGTKGSSGYDHPSIWNFLPKMLATFNPVSLSTSGFKFSVGVQDPGMGIVYGKEGRMSWLNDLLSPVLLGAQAVGNMAVSAVGDVLGAARDTTASWLQMWGATETAEYLKSIGVAPPLGTTTANIPAAKVNLPALPQTSLDLSSPLIIGGGYGGALQQPTITQGIGMSDVIMPSPGDVTLYPAAQIAGSQVVSVTRQIQAIVKAVTGKHMSMSQIKHVVREIGPAAFMQATGLGIDAVIYILGRPTRRRGRGITAVDLRRTRSTLRKVKNIRTDLRRFCAVR